MKYEIIRPMFGGHLTQSQVDGIEAILAVCKGLSNKRYVAYILATVFHETAKTMKPIEEYGKGAGHDYGKKLKMGKGPGKRIAYTMPDKIYYGRGYVQLTWYENYQYLGKLIGQDLLNHPELALNPTIAAEIMMVGMQKGAFTGVSLSTYFNEHHSDAYNARRIINGTDCAGIISGYYNTFYKALG